MKGLDTMERRTSKSLYLISALAVILSIGCSDPIQPKSEAVPNLRGVWDMTLAPQNPSPEAYTVSVEMGGGSGANKVLINGPFTSDTVSVVAGDSVQLGTCGVWMVFGDTAGFNLAAGDFWEVLVSNRLPDQPIAGDTVDSVVGPVRSGGQDLCGTAPCDGSVFGSALPGPSLGLIPDLTPGGKWYSVRLAQNGARIASAVPEEQILSLYPGTVLFPAFGPPLVNIGDSVTLTYRRATNGDGQGGDFMRVTINDGTDLADAEYLYGPDFAQGDTVVSLTLTAKSADMRIDFIGGLSEVGEFIRLDDVQISVAGLGVVFQDDFETGPAGDCGPLGARWEVRQPSWRVGSLCVAVLGSLSGSYSARWNGGSTRTANGTLITQSSSSGLTSLLGDFGGLFGGIEGLSGLFLSANEPVWTNYLTVFTLAQQGQDNLVGTFKGESQNHVCTETGQVLASIHRNQETDLASSFWVMGISGQAVDCQPALSAGNTLEFADLLTTASGDTIDMFQIGTIFVAGEDAIDDYLNAYQIQGSVQGTLVTGALNESGGTSSANMIGTINGNTVEGALAGRMTFDAGRVCTLAPGSGFQVSLIPK